MMAAVSYEGRHLFNSDSKFASETMTRVHLKCLSCWVTGSRGKQSQERRGSEMNKGT